MGRSIDEAERLFENWFQPRLEYQLSRLPPILSDHQKEQLNNWAALLGETDASLRARSKQRQSVRRRARTFAKNVLVISAELFDLCSLSLTISALPSIPDGSFYDYLRTWWTAQVSKTPFPENAKQISSGVPSIEANRESPAISAPLNEPGHFTFRHHTDIPQSLNNLHDASQGGFINIMSTGKLKTSHKL